MITRRDNYGRVEFNPAQCTRNGHLYVLEAARLFGNDNHGELVVEHELHVHAPNRNVAAARAKRAGYEVYSVNMIG